MSGRRRITPEAQARADRIAAALSGLLEDEPPEPSAPRTVGDPYRPVPKAPTSSAPRSSYPCPGCREALHLDYARGVQIHRCIQCHGIWLDPGELDEMVGDSEDQVETVDVTQLRQRMEGVAPPQDAVQYRPCARCGNPMNRRNFGDLSGVIVDECPSHGMFLDPGEFEAIEAFMRLGGLTLQRERLAERNRAREHRETARQAVAAALSNNAWFDRRSRYWWQIFLWTIVAP